MSEGKQTVRESERVEKIGRKGEKTKWNGRKSAQINGHDKWVWRLKWTKRNNKIANSLNSVQWKIHCSSCEAQKNTHAMQMFVWNYKTGAKQKETLKINEFDVLSCVKKHPARNGVLLFYVFF